MNQEFGLGNLSESQWQEVLNVFRRPRKSFLSLSMSYLRWRLAWAAVTRAGRRDAKEAALRAVRAQGFDDSQDEPPYDRMTIIGSATFALVVRDAIAPKHFQTLYQPFCQVIPLVP